MCLLVAIERLLTCRWCTNQDDNFPTWKGTYIYLFHLFSATYPTWSFHVWILDVNPQWNNIIAVVILSKKTTATHRDVQSSFEKTIKSWKQSALFFCVGFGFTMLKPFIINRKYLKINSRCHESGQITIIPKPESFGDLGGPLPYNQPPFGGFPNQRERSRWNLPRWMSVEWTDPELNEIQWIHRFVWSQKLGKEVPK